MTRSLVLIAVWIIVGGPIPPLAAQTRPRTSSLSSETVEGFAEAYATVGLASSESGIITRLLVNEGDKVAAGDPIATLDDDLHRALLSIAQHQAEGQGRIEAALAECDLHRSRYAKLSDLRSRGQAHQEELDRARVDVEMAEGRLKAEYENQKLMQLELQKAQVQLARRTVVAPMDGTITSVHKHPGEYVSPASPEVVTLVQLDPLRAVFLVPRVYASRLAANQQVELRFPVIQRTSLGVIEYVSQVIDAESGTVTVKVRIENRQGHLRGGERCLLDIP